MPSRQAAYQRRMREQGRCMICGRPRCPESAVYCETHLFAARISGRNSKRKTRAAEKALASVKKDM